VSRRIEPWKLMSPVEAEQWKLCLHYVASVQWLRAAHEARMRGATIHFINATDRSPVPVQRSLL